jgi:hypothetical protein
MNKEQIIKTLNNTLECNDLKNEFEIRLLIKKLKEVY